MLQCGQRVIDGQQTRLIGVASKQFASDNGSDRALGQRGLNKFVAVQALSADGKKQFTRLNGARVDGIADSDGIRVVCALGLQELGDLRQAELHDPTGCAAAYPACCRAFVATSTSSKGTEPS